MHVYPESEDENMWADGDLVFIAGPNTVKCWRIKERFLQPAQHVIDRVALDDDKDWCYFDDTKLFCYLEVIGMAPNTEEGIAGLVALGK